MGKTLSGIALASGAVILVAMILWNSFTSSFGPVPAENADITGINNSNWGSSDVEVRTQTSANDESVLPIVPDYEPAEIEDESQ